MNPQSLRIYVSSRISDEQWRRGKKTQNKKKRRKKLSLSSLQVSPAARQRAYRGMLKLQLDWTVSKVVWYDQVVQLRALFEKNLAAGSTTAEAFLQQVEHDLKTYKHPDPYKFPFYEYKDENGIVVGTGTKFQRNTPPPQFVLDGDMHDHHGQKH